MCVFLDKSDFYAHEARVCIHDGRLLSDKRRERRYSEEQYFKSPEEMQELFSDLPEALENTVHLAQRCNLEMEFDTYHLPDFPTPDQLDVETFLRQESEAGLKEPAGSNTLQRSSTRKRNTRRAWISNWA